MRSFSLSLAKFLFPPFRQTSIVGFVRIVLHVIMRIVATRNEIIVCPCVPLSIGRLIPSIELTYIHPICEMVYDIGYLFRSHIGKHSTEHIPILCPRRAVSIPIVLGVATMAHTTARVLLSASAHINTNLHDLSLSP